MDKITVNPLKVRGRGNVLSPKFSREFSAFYASFSKSNVNVENYTHAVFRLIFEPNSRFIVEYPKWMPFINKNNPLVIKATLVNTASIPLANKPITFNGEDYFTDSNGEVTFTIKTVDVDYGILNYTLNFVGTDRIPSASESFSIQLGYIMNFTGPSEIEQEQVYNYSVLVTDNEGNPITNVPVNFKFYTNNSIMLGSFQSITDEDGVANCTKYILGYSGNMIVEVTVEHSETITNSVQVNDLPTVYEVLSDMGLANTFFVKRLRKSNGKIVFDKVLTSNQSLTLDSLQGVVMNLRIENGIVKYDEYESVSQSSGTHMTLADREALDGVIYNLKYENRLVTFESMEVEGLSIGADVGNIIEGATGIVGSFKINSKGHLIVSLPAGVTNPYSIKNGHLVVNIPYGTSNPYTIQNGHLFYNTD